jgi:Na+/proline symporter
MANSGPLGQQRGVLFVIVISIVNAFVIPSEVGHMYAADGETAPMTGWTGLWILLPLVGWFVWVVKVQGALNRYWESHAAPATA